MIERRYETRTVHNTPAMILVDEHRTLPCIVSDRSATGIRVTLPSTDDVPDTFILTLDSSDETLVCRAAWRKPDQIGCIADPLVPAWIVGRTIARQPSWF
jgi:hypothetical protein